MKNSGKIIIHSDVFTVLEDTEINRVSYYDLSKKEWIDSDLPCKVNAKEGHTYIIKLADSNRPYLQDISPLDVLLHKFPDRNSEIVEMKVEIGRLKYLLSERNAEIAKKEREIELLKETYNL